MKRSYESASISHGADEYFPRSGNDARQNVRAETKPPTTKRVRRTGESSTFESGRPSTGEDEAQLSGGWFFTRATADGSAPRASGHIVDSPVDHTATPLPVNRGSAGVGSLNTVELPGSEEVAVDDAEETGAEMDLDVQDTRRPRPRRNASSQSTGSSMFSGGSGGGGDLNDVDARNHREPDDAALSRDVCAILRSTKTALDELSSRHPGCETEDRMGQLKEALVSCTADFGGHLSRGDGYATCSPASPDSSPRDKGRQTPARPNWKQTVLQSVEEVEKPSTAALKPKRKGKKVHRHSPVREQSGPCQTERVYRHIATLHQPLPFSELTRACSPPQAGKMTHRRLVEERIDSPELVAYEGDPRLPPTDPMQGFQESYSAPSPLPLPAPRPCRPTISILAPSRF